MYKAFKYRLYPTRQQQTAMRRLLETHRHLYNRALAERKTAWEEERRSIHFFEQSARLKTDRQANPYLAQTNFGSCWSTLRRLDKAFQAFFRRVKAGETPGYPRFKSRDRFDTVEFPNYGDGCKIDGSRVYFQHVGKVRAVLHRPIEGKIKTVSFTRRADAWYVVAVCDLGERTATPDPGPPVGIDVGLEKFATLSTGEMIANPRFFRQDQKALARAQRRLSKEAKGTAKRARRKRVVRKIHERIAHRRADFAHKLSRRLVSEFGVIVFEHLNIARMMHNHHLAKGIADAAWSQLVHHTIYKAAEAGRTCLQVDPRGTSQRCSSCGMVVKKALSERMHECPACGLTIDRDLNAALNILAVGLHSLGENPEKPLP